MHDLDVYYYESDNIVELKALTQALAGTVVTTATVTVDLLNEVGASIAGPFAMVHDVGGTYRYVLQDTIVINQGDRLTALVVADAGVDLKRTWRTPLIVRDSE